MNSFKFVKFLGIACNFSKLREAEKDENAWDFCIAIAGSILVYRIFMSTPQVRFRQPGKTLAQTSF